LLPSTSASFTNTLTATAKRSARLGTVLGQYPICSSSFITLSPSSLTCFHHSINYEPKSDTQYFRSSTCRPGDYRGLNIRTQALASCSFTEDGITPIIVSDVVASQVGASLA
jgi:hypothetical protein